MRASSRDAAVPMPPAASPAGRTMPRSPGSSRPPPADRSLPRPPASRPPHHAADRPMPRPPTASPADRSLPRPPGAGSRPDRPLPRPLGSRPAAPEQSIIAQASRPPGEPSPPSTASPEHHDTERPLRLPPGQHHHQPPPWPYSYSDHHAHAPPRRASSPLASCLAATAFLLLALGGAGTALFLLFRPRPPDIAVAAVRLPAFAAANGTVAFTFQQTAVVRNPNRSPLAHFDSSLRVATPTGGELGYAYIPAGLIDGGRAKDMSATFDVTTAFPSASATPPPQQQMAAATVAAAPPIMEVDSLLVVKGRVTMLRVLTHRVQAAKVCRVAVSPLDGRVLGFRC